MTNLEPDAPPYWVHIMLFYPGEIDDNLRRACDQELKRFDRLRSAGTVIAEMIGFMSGGIEAPHAPVPLMVVVSSSSDISFELALEDSIDAILVSGMQWAFTVNLGGEPIAQASDKARILIQNMMQDPDRPLSRVTARHRDAVATEAASAEP